MTGSMGNGATCCRCQRTGRVGETETNAGTPITWVCAVCDEYVCLECTLVVPGSVPREFYETTFCSVECRDRHREERHRSDSVWACSCDALDDGPRPWASSFMVKRVFGLEVAELAPSMSTERVKQPCDECDPSFGCFDGSVSCQKEPLV